MLSSTHPLQCALCLSHSPCLLSPPGPPERKLHEGRHRGGPSSGLCPGPTLGLLQVSEVILSGGWLVEGTVQGLTLAVHPSSQHPNEARRRGILLWFLLIPLGGGLIWAYGPQCLFQVTTFKGSMNFDGSNYIFIFTVLYLNVNSSFCYEHVRQTTVVLPICPCHQ